MCKKCDKPSVYTELYWLIQDKKVNSEYFLEILKVCWPEFIKKDRYIFLKEKFSQEKYDYLIKEKCQPDYWINLLTVDSFFEKTAHIEQYSKKFIEFLVEIWKAKLKQDFPDMSFIIEYIYNKECGDYGLSFYINEDNSSSLVVFQGEIPEPNIKESKLEKSLNGPRPGYPEIRMPNQDEVPKGTKSFSEKDG